MQGTSPGSLSAEGGHSGQEERRVWRNTNFVGDIVGAQADTVVHSIRTQRHVNPLNPTYISLDGALHVKRPGDSIGVGRNYGSPSIEWFYDMPSFI